MSEWGRGKEGGGGGCRFQSLLQGLLLLSVFCLLEISYEILPRGCDLGADKLPSPGQPGDCGVLLALCRVCFVLRLRLVSFISVSCIMCFGHVSFGASILVLVSLILDIGCWLLVLHLGFGSVNGGYGIFDSDPMLYITCELYFSVTVVF